MRYIYVILTTLFSVVITNTSSLAKDANNDGQTNSIYYKSIIYFEPDTAPPSQNKLAKRLKEFTPIETAPNTVDKPYSRIEITSDFVNSYPAPGLDYLAYAGRGLSKAQAETLQKTKHIMVLDVIYPDKNYLDNYKTVNRFLYDVASEYSGFIWDSETRELFTPDAWKEKRLASYSGRYPDIVNHITIHAYNNDADEGIRAITLGMAKFGRPDVVINNFSWSLADPMGNLINLVSQSLLEGMTPNQSGELTLNIDNLQNETHRNRLKTSLKENAVLQLTVNYDEAEAEEGDPDNYLLEVLFDKVDGGSLSERQDKTLSALFGWEDSIAYVNHDAEILAASARAKARLYSLRKDFGSGLNPGEFILLKAPFETTSGGNEWMWVEVTSWDKKSIRGLLKNEPYNVPELKAGSMVTINQDDVFDYIRNFPDGTSEGNETGKIMLKARGQ
jgi:uncharacterized protein YegJ (DUF2314 family)